MENDTWNLILREFGKPSRKMGKAPQYKYLPIPNDEAYT